MVAPEILGILTAKKASSDKTPALSESMNMNIQVVGTSNQLIITGSYTETKFSKKIKYVLAKLCSLSQVPFKRAVLYGYDMLSIVLLSRTKQFSSLFFFKGFCFSKICFKVKALKTFKISSDCHTKKCQCKKCQKSVVSFFQTNLCSFCWL